MTVEITYYFKSKDTDSKIVATFGIKIPEWDLYFNDMKLIKTLNGGLFVAGPSHKYTDKEGKDQYKNYWHFGKENNKRFMETVLKEVQKYIEKEFGNQKTPMKIYDEEAPF